MRQSHFEGVQVIWNRGDTGLNSESKMIVILSDKTGHMSYNLMLASASLHKHKQRRKNNNTISVSFKPLLGLKKELNLIHQPWD